MYTGLHTIPQVPNFMKIHPVGPKWFYADRHDEANSCFSECCEQVKKTFSVIMTNNK